MARLRFNNALGKLGAGLASGDTTITFLAAPSLGGVGGGDYVPLVIDPAVDSSNPSFEVVYLTAYTPGSVTGTITRGQEGTTALAHTPGTLWVCGPLAGDDFGQRQYTGLEVSGASYTQGVGSFDARHGFASILGARLEVPVLNHAVGGSVTAWDKTVLNGSGGGGWANVLYDVQAPLNGVAPYLPQRTLSLIAYGFNDLWHNNNLMTTPGWTYAGPSLVSAMRLIIARHRSAANIGITNTTIFPSASFSNVTFATTAKSGDGNFTLKSTASPASCVVNVPADFDDPTGPGSAFTIFGTVWPAAAGTITFAVNGTAKPAHTITLSSICNSSTINVINGWCARFLTSEVNPGDAITVTMTYTAGPVTVNGAMVEASGGPVVVVQNTPHVPAPFATYGWASQAAMWADIDTLNAAEASLCAEFTDGNVILEDITGVLGSTAYGTSGSLYASDNLHPSPRGHAAIATDLEQLVLAKNVTAAISAQGALFPPARTRGSDTKLRTTSAAAAYQMVATDTFLGLVGTVAQAVTLPDASSVCPDFSVNGGSAALFYVKDEAGNAAAHNKTLTPINSQTIEGQASYTITSNFGGVLLASTGLEWFVVADIWAPKAWDTLNFANGLLASATAAGQYSIAQANVAAYAGQNGLYGLIYLDSNDFPTNGLGVASKIRLTGQVVTNAVAQTATFTFGLYPVATWGGASGINPEIATLGTLVASAAIAAPAANTPTATESSTANFPTSGWYVVTVTTSAAIATNGPVMVGYRLEAQRA